MDSGLASGRTASANHGLRDRKVQGDVGAQEDAQEPVRRNPQGGGLDATERAHGYGPELKHGATDHPPRWLRCLMVIANIRFTDCVNFDRICIADQ
jgi:hypothetical protein